MDTIDISQNIQDFKQVFEKESRIIFSAKFGDGKSYFQKKFMESRVASANVMLLLILSKSLWGRRKQSLFLLLKIWTE